MTQAVDTFSGSIGRYKPIADLGQGGMAKVYLAAASGPGGFTKLVVIKELKPELAEDPEFMAMFLDEARLAARLSHPNIVQTFEVQTTNDRHAIVMEYLDGQPLSRVRAKIGELGEFGTAVQLRIIADALGGLHHAHDLCDYDGSPLSVVHRDVSPHNVFITYAGQAKVVDFGIAKAADTSSQTRVGVIKGKLSYMSPEQAMGDKSVPIDRRADVFAAGIMIWEAVCGRRLWKGLEEFAIMHRLATGEIPRVREIVPNASPLIDEICARALAIRPGDRYPSADALRQDLELYIASCPVKLSSHEVGQKIAQVFDNDRKKIRDTIERQLKLIRQPEAGSSGALPQLGPHHAGTPSASQMSGLSAHATMVTPPYPRSIAPPRKSGFWIALAGMAIVLGAIAVWFVIKNAQQTIVQVPPPATTTQPTATQPTVTATAPAKVRITVSTQPENAKVTLDGKPIGDALDRDDKDHDLKVEAAGYVTDARKIKLDRDQAIPIILTKKTKPATGTGTIVKPTGTGEGDELGF